MLAPTLAGGMMKISLGMQTRNCGANRACSQRHTPDFSTLRAATFFATENLDLLSEKCIFAKEIVQKTSFLNIKF